MTPSAEETLKRFDEIGAAIEAEKAKQARNRSSGNGDGSRLDVPRYCADHGLNISNIKSLSDGTLYCLEHCIFDENHTRNESAIGQTSNGMLTYQCHHESCRGRTWADARRTISGDKKLGNWMNGGNGANSTRDYKPPEPDGTTDASSSEKAETDLRPAVLESEEFISKEMPEKVVYLDPWLSALSIILITGSRGIGKSWFLLSLLLAISKLKPFGPWAAVNSAPCLYLDGEMAAQDLQERLIALDQDGVKVSPLHIYSDAYASSQGLQRANLLNPAWRKDMKSLLLDLGVKVWAVDNIASLTPGIDENSKQDWDPINQWLLELRFNEITTALAHHTNRSGGQRGTSGREDNIDISILLKQPEGYTAEDGASFIASFTKARISIPHLSKIADTAFQMQQEADGKTVWTWGTLKQQRSSQILALHKEGVSKKDIANELNCSFQNVSQTILRYEKSQEFD